MKNEKGTIVLAGGVIGLIAAILVFFGNPANMGFFIACFLRDTTGGSIRQLIRDFLFLQIWKKK